MRALRRIANFLPRSFGQVFKKAQNDVRAVTPNQYADYPSDFIGNCRPKITDSPYLSSALFKDVQQPCPWLDAPNALSLIEEKLVAGDITKEQAEACRTFANDGYFIAEKLLPEEFVGSVFQEYLEAWYSGKIKPVPGDRRYLNPHKVLKGANDLLNHPSIIELCNLFLGVKAVPFQTIGAEFGSGQLEHSDAIHMTTVPNGYLVAAWVACEDVHPDSGPLVYYPGSHRLPYYLTDAVGIDQSEFRTQGYKVYSEKYEPFVQSLIKDRNLPTAYFDAKKGDVLFWHHNLIHGGSPIVNPELTRHSIVGHYFGQGALWYHDLAGLRVNLRKIEQVFV